MVVSTGVGRQNFQSDFILSADKPHQKSELIPTYFWIYTSTRSKWATRRWAKSRLQGQPEFIFQTPNPTKARLVACKLDFVYTFHFRSSAHFSSKHYAWN